jgi:N4-gp56 family major capsid protein
MMTKEAGKALSRELNEVVIPSVDVYRLSRIAAGAGTTVTGDAITGTTAYSAFLDAVTALLDAKIPLAGIVAFIGSNFYKQIRVDNGFIKASDVAQNMLINGQVGKVEGIPLVYVPSSYLPANVEFILTSKIAVTAAQKLADYRVHENPPGINGWLVEGRIYHDTFVLNNKKNAIYVYQTSGT